MNDKALMKYLADTAKPLLRVPKFEIVVPKGEGGVAPELDYTQSLFRDKEQKTQAKEGVLYCWNGQFWESMVHSAEEHAAKWISLHHPKKATPQTVRGAVAFAAILRIRIQSCHLFA